MVSHVLPMVSRVNPLASHVCSSFTCELHTQHHKHVKNPHLTVERVFVVLSLCVFRVNHTQVGSFINIVCNRWNRRLYVQAFTCRGRSLSGQVSWMWEGLVVLQFWYQTLGGVKGRRSGRRRTSTQVCVICLLVLNGVVNSQQVTVRDQQLRLLIVCLCTARQMLLLGNRCHGNWYKKPQNISRRQLPAGNTWEFVKFSTKCLIFRHSLLRFNEFKEFFISSDFETRREKQRLLELNLEEHFWMTRI